MFEIVTSAKFLKDLKLLKKRSIKDLQILQQLITILAENGHKGLDKKHKPHKLSGSYKGYWECHVKPDLLLIWDENEQINLLELVRTGTHSDLFKYRAYYSLFQLVLPPPIKQKTPFSFPKRHLGS